MKRFYELRIIIRDDGSETAMEWGSILAEQAPARTAHIDEFFGTIYFSEWYEDNEQVRRFAAAIDKEA